MARRLLIIALWMLLALPARAQDGLNLPTDLYVLLNDGQIQRYGVGATGVVNLTPPGLFIIDFGVDASGQRVAFRTESGLYVIDIAAGGQPQQWDGAGADVPPYRGAGDTIAWSPSGDALADTTTYGARVYFTGNGTPIYSDLREGVFKSVSWSPGGRFLAAEADQGIWWIYRRDGTNLPLTSVVPSSTGMAWASDSELVFAPVEGGLRLMNLDQANAQAVLLDESVKYQLPQLDTNNALVIFGRDPNDANVPEGYGRLLRLARGAQQLETIGQVPVALTGLRWAPGGTLLVAFQGGVIALYDPSTGLGFPLPMTDVVAYAWGPINPTPLVPVAAPTAAESPTPSPPTETPLPTTPPEPTTIPVNTVTALTLSADSFFLAPAIHNIVQVWRMPANGTPPQQFTGSGSDVNEYAVSPDGKTAAYVVDAELWLQVEGQQPGLVAKINSFAPVEADFSGDSAQIAYVDERSGIWLDVIEENAPQLIRANGEDTYHRPQFSPDGTRLLLDVYKADGGTAVGVLDLTTHSFVKSPPAPPDDPRPVQTHWLRDGRIYTYLDANATTSAASGFYILDSTAPGSTPAEWVSVPAEMTVRSSVEAVTGTLRALLASGSSAFAPLSVVDFDLATGQSTPVLDIGAVIAPQLSPDGRFVGGYESLTEIDGVQQGAILVVDLQTGRRFQLSNPATAWGFRWSAP